jgi:hypothetical protein
MDKNDVLSFRKVLAESHSKCRSLLIGNGFSKSISTRFSYEDLPDLINNNKNLEKHYLSDDLINIFTDLDTVDFEKIIAHLEVCRKSIKFILKK